MLVSLVLIAFTWVYTAVMYLDFLKPIKIKKHGERTKSMFKYGFNYMVNLLFSNNINKFNQCCKFLSCTWYKALTIIEKYSILIS